MTQLVADAVLRGDVQLRHDVERGDDLALPAQEYSGASITQSSVVMAAQVTLSRRSAPCAYSSAVRRSAARSMSRVSWLSFMRVLLGRILGERV